MNRLFQLKTMVLLGLFLAISACLTVNIYFPVSTVEKTAETIVDDVYGTEKETTKPEEPGNSSLMDWPSWLGPRAAYAEDATTVSNANIKSLKDQIAANHGKLLPFYNSGHLGITQNGLLEIRNTDGLPLPDVATLRRLTAADNQARDRLYQEVAQALNLQPQQVSQVQQIFADQWRGKAQSGWWIQGNNGAWTKK
jgi:uncharacterized protein YdbL (DUF1318 family)